MTRTQFALLLFTAAVAAMLGGAVSNLLLFGTAASAQRVSQHERTLSAEEFRVVDRGGRTLATLGTDEHGARLVLFDRTGETRLIAGLDPLGESFLSLHDRGGEFRVLLGTWFTGRPQVALFDRVSTQRASLALGDKEEPSLSLKDRGSMARLSVKLSADGDPGVMLMDTQETIRAHMGFTEDEDVTLNLYDGDGRPRAAFGVYADGGPTVQLADEGGNIRAALGSSPAGSGGAAPERPRTYPLTLFDNAGRVIWSAP